jgi:HAD superfamily hydrolase (TIGR01509 family)
LGCAPREWQGRSASLGSGTVTGPPPIKALLFDFDGTILETEESCFLAWREIFERHGRDLDLGEWESAVGTVGGFDPVATLREHTGGKVDLVAVLKEQATRRMQLLEGEGLRPGILPLLEEALEAGIAVAIVTSNREAWVDAQLSARGHLGRWPLVIAADEDPLRSKPLPLMYVEALERLSVAPTEALALEDSRNGVAAAKAAGVWCVAYPNAVTQNADLSEADAVVWEADGLRLADLFRVVGVVQLTNP